MRETEACTTPSCPDNPLLSYLGIRLVHVEEGKAQFDMQIDARHLNRQDSLQGGVSAALLDAACGYAGLAGPDGTVSGNAVTVMLNISYLRKVSTGRLRATGTVSRMGRSMYFAVGELQDDGGEIVATAQGAFKRQGESRSPSHLE